MSHTIFRSFFTYILFLSLDALPQSSPDTLSAFMNFEIADSIRRKGNFDEANSYFEKASVLYQKAGVHHRHLDCILEIAENYLDLADLEQATLKSKYAYDYSLKYMGDSSLGNADALYMLGRITLDKQEEGLGLREFHRALDIYKWHYDEFSFKIVRVYNSIGALHMQSGNLDEARKYWLLAIKDIKSNLGEDNTSLINLYSNLGGIFGYKGDYDSAVWSLQKALSIVEVKLGEKHRLTGILYHNIGEIYLHQGFYHRAIDYMTRSLEIKTELFGSNNGNLAVTYGNLGKVYRRQEKYGPAISHLEKSLAILISAFGETNSNVADAYASLGEAYIGYGGESLVAMKHLQNAVKIYKSLGLKFHGLAVTYSYIALEYLKRKEYSLALEYCRKSLDVWRSINPNHPEISQIFDIIGNVYSVQKQYDLAIENHLKSTNSFETNVGSRHPMLASYYLNLSITYRASGDINSSLFYLTKAQMANSVELADTLHMNSVKLGHAFDTFLQLKIAYNHAITLENQSRKPSDILGMENALLYYQLSDSIMDKMSSIQSKIKTKLKFEEYRSEVYSRAVILSGYLFELTNLDRYKVLAFYFSEKSKVRILSESSFDRYAKKISYIPDTLLQREREIGTKLSYYESLLKDQEGGLSSEMINDYKSKVFNLEKDYNTLIGFFEERYPKYYELKYRNTVLSIEEVINSTPPGQAVLEYHLVDSIGYLFLITKESFQMHQIGDTEKVVDAIDELRSSLQPTIDASQMAPFNLTASTFLYEELIYPVKTVLLSEDIKKLVIVADKELHYLPFELLVRPKQIAANERDWVDPRYLIMDYSIGYAYSSTLYFEKSRQVLVPSENIISFAPTYSSMVTDLNSDTTASFLALRDAIVPLDWNTKEVSSISEYFSNDLHYGEHATEKKFKEDANKYGAIHLAMHAFVDEKDPLNSKMVFYQGEDTLEDGYLHAFELFNMELSSNLAILSACQTGYGKLVKGEGILSLGQGFAYAGVPSIVMSHWQVDDQSTSILMKYLYENLHSGLSKSEALRQAKLDYLKEASPNKSHPFFWGAFVVMGDDSAIVSGNLSWLYIALLLLIIGIIFFTSKRKNAKEFKM